MEVFRVRTKGASGRWGQWRDATEIELFIGGRTMQLFTSPKGYVILKGINYIVPPGSIVGLELKGDDDE